MAQGSASVEGVVRDTSGAVVPGVSVTVRNVRTDQARATTTDAAGSFTVLGLPPAEFYELQAAIAGFRPSRQLVQSLAAGERRVTDLRLEPAGVTASVNVTPDAAIARTTTPELGGSLTQARIEQVPTNGRDLVSLAYLVPGAAPARGFYNLAPRLTINGSSSLVTNYAVDGFDNTDLFLGGPKVPVTVASTQNLAILVNSYSTEYGRTGNGVFAVTTKSGANLTSGDAFLTVRPGNVLDAPNYFAPRGSDKQVLPDSFRRTQAGGTLGGRVVTDRTFFFVNAEVTREEQDAILTSPLSAGLAPTSFHNLEAMTKLDQRWNERQSTSVRYLFSDYTHDQDAGFIGGLTLPSAGLQVNYRNQYAALTHRSIVGRQSLNELGLQVGQLRANWRSLDPGPRAIVTDRGATLAVIGAVSNDFFWTESDLQVRDVFSHVAGRHSLEAGADLLRGAFDIRSGPGARGAYVVDLAGRTVVPSGPFLSVSDVPRDVMVLSYSQSFVNPEVIRTQTLVGAFVEDSIRAAADLTLTLGARWDYDSVTNTPVGRPDLNNVAPRTGFSWTPGGSQRHQVRGGFGIFYERIPFAVYSDTVFNSPAAGAIDVTFAPGTPFAPPRFPATLPPGALSNIPVSQLPPRNVQVFDPNLKSPWNAQFSIGYVVTLAWDAALSVDYVHNSGHNLIRRIDINAPTSPPGGAIRTVAEADATRPVAPAPGGFRLIEQDQSSGRSRFDGVYINLRKRYSHGIALDLAYTLSRTLNNTDDINFRPVDSRRPDAEWGASLNDRRHVLALNAIVRLPLRIDLAPVLFVSSGQPLNPLTGVDNNGDTIFNDRPAGARRNTLRTSGFRQLDLGIVREFHTTRGAIELRADVFNVLNTVNFSGFFNFGASGVRPDETGTLAYQPTVAGPARQFQFQARYRF
jgi:hypothetical protein